MVYPNYSMWKYPMRKWQVSCLRQTSQRRQQKTELVDKAILKKKQNHLSMDFSKPLSYFTPNLGAITMDILDKKNKKPQMYCHGSCILDSSTNFINKLVDCKVSKLAIRYQPWKSLGALCRVPVKISCNLPRFYSWLIWWQCEWGFYSVNLPPRHHPWQYWLTWG